MRLDSATSIQQSDGTSPWWAALPFGLQDVRVSRDTRPEGFRFSKFIINIEATLDGGDIRSCGEADDESIAMTKAIMELIERSSLMRWYREHRPGVFGTSNGWAAHETIAQAKNNAVLELVERDAVLAQWYLALPFLEIPSREWPREVADWARTELFTSEFQNMRILVSTEGLGPSVTCLFVNGEGYGVSGHAAKETLRESIDAAIAETCRAAHNSIRRSFWNDSLTLLKGVGGARVQPGAHTVFYAYHRPFPQWMFGSEISWREAVALWNERIASLLQDKDFVFQQTLKSPVVVGFATHPQALELTWGCTDIPKVLKQAENRMFSVTMQERTLNTQPHIVS